MGQDGYKPKFLTRLFWRTITRVTSEILVPAGDNIQEAIDTVIGGGGVRKTTTVKQWRLPWRWQSRTFMEERVILALGIYVAEQTISLPSHTSLIGDPGSAQITKEDRGKPIGKKGGPIGKVVLLAPSLKTYVHLRLLRRLGLINRDVEIERDQSKHSSQNVSKEE